jgi:carboxymethylenebutenolidase
MATITEQITFPSGNRQLEGYFARPEGEGPFPGLVVIHEIFGLTENIKRCAQRFAQAGYAALAVDLFAGRNRTVCMFSMMSGLLFNSLNHQGIQDLKTTLNYLEAQPCVDRERVGAVGYCMGGSLAIAWACTDNRLKAIAPYYAQNPRPQEALRRLCPVVGSYPARDFTTKPGQQLDLALDQFGIAHDIKIYPNSTHSFCNEDRAGSYNREVAEDSWERVLAFFGEHIKSKAAV